MTNQLTRSEVEGLIERLADKTLSFGCKIITPEWNDGVSYEVITGTHHGDRIEYECVFRNGTIYESDITNIIGHPIYIGDVLEKMQQARLISSEMFFTTDLFIDRWRPLGFSKSLQEIVSESGWNEHVECNICGDPCSTICSNNTILRWEVLKSPEANALFSFLIQIGL